MLTDLENSTRLWETYPGKMRAILARHDELIEKAVGDNAGLVIKPRGEGDSRFVVFSRANDAVLAAAEVQRALDQEPWTMPENIRVRIAVHTGSAELHDGDYYGPTVNRCARLRSITHGGQILITQVTHNLVHDSLPPELAFLDLGEHKLKDISQAERIYQLVVPGLPADFPPLPTPIRLVQNLPVILTSFIGRKSEVAQVTNLLTTRRLITISGPGGVGKTRLAVQSALLALEHFPDGGWFIDFTSITNPALVTQHLMTTLGIYEDSCCSPAERLEYYFHDKTMLIIVDNCEHVLPGVTQLVHFLLAATDRLTILATSREPLGVVGETIWYIAPLSTPEPGEEISLETLLTYESVALFVERAAAISDFELTDRNALAVAQVCARLDGIPLALELAAARTKVLSAADLAERLNDRFSLLASNQNVPRRQRTLRNLIDWSYDLLPEKERVLLRRLSIFAGGWMLQEIEQICAGDNLDSAEVLDLLIHLVDRSLVISETVGDGKRYRLLETIRQYGQERLNESQESEVLARRHATHFTRLAEDLASELWGSRQGECLRQLDLEHDNLRAALEWMASTEDMAGMMLRLGGALWRFWRIRGHYQEGRMRLDQALARSSSEARGLRAEGLRGAAILALQQGEYVPATKLIEQSLALQREIGNKQGIGHALDLLGEIAHYQGDYDQAIAYHEQSLAMRSEIGDQHGLANSLRQLGVIARERGDFQQAEAHLTRSLALGRRLDDRILLAKTLDNLGLVEHHRCNYDRANQLFTEAVLICRELNDRLGISNTLQNLGNAAKDQGEFRKAKATYDECLRLKQALGDRRGIAQTLASLAELAFYQGKYNKAAELADRSLGLFRDLGVKRGVIFTLGLLAYTAQYNGRFEQAAALANECLQLATELNAPRPVAYCKEVIGLIAYAQDNLDRARHYFLEAIDLFEKVGDRRNVASAMINLARTIYRQGDHATALKHVNDSLDISHELNLRWTLSLGLEISGLLHRSQHNDGAALISFQESLRISLEQDNRQGIANCLGAIGGLAVIANQAEVALTLFAAAQRIREEIGAGMGSGDQAEYEYYLTLARQQIAEHEFRPIWQRGAELALDQVFELAQIQRFSRRRLFWASLIAWRLSMRIETAADINFLIGAHFASASLTAALERGLFWRFDGRPQSIGALADSLGMSPGICRNWLRMLASLGMLEEVDDGYALSDTAQTAIIQAHDAATWAELAIEERRRWPGDLALVNQLFNIGPVEHPLEESSGQFSDYVQDMAEDPERAYQFTHMLYDLHRPLAEDVAHHLDLTGVTRLLDIGGGSGVVSLALLEKYPELTATVVDIANVCAVGRQIADSTPEAGRINYHPANFRLDEFPGRFDLILSCDIMGYDQDLIEKIAASLEAGGRFVIVDRWFEEPQTWTIWHSSYLLRRSLREPDFSMPSMAQLYSRLESAGLEPISCEEIPYGRWQMIQARKNA